MLKLQMCYLAHFCIIQLLNVQFFTLHDYSSSLAPNYCFDSCYEPYRRIKERKKIKYFVCSSYLKSDCNNLFCCLCGKNYHIKIEIHGYTYMHVYMYAWKSKFTLLTNKTLFKLQYIQKCCGVLVNLTNGKLLWTL